MLFRATLGLLYNDMVLGSLIIGYSGIQVGMYILSAFLLLCGGLFYLVCPAKTA